MGTRIFIENARLSYPHLFVPRAVKQGDQPKYSASLIIPANHPAIQQIQNAEALERQNKWGAQVPHNCKPVPMRQGDPNDPAQAQSVVLNANNQDKPPIVDEGAIPVIDQGKFYPGCPGLRYRFPFPD